MEIVKDLNVSELPVFDLEEFGYYEFLWERIFGDGEYTDNGCDEAVGFNSGRSCSAEYYENTMVVRFAKVITDENLFLTAANIVIGNITGIQNKRIIDCLNNSVVIDMNDCVYLSIRVDSDKRHVVINSYKKYA